MNKNNIIIIIFVTTVFYLIAANHYLLFPFHKMKMNEEEVADMMGKVNTLFVKDSKIYDIGIGDSLLDKYDIVDILKNQNDWDTNAAWLVSDFHNLSNALYDSISVGYKRNDKNFIVDYVSGNIFYKKDIEKCYSRKKTIIKSLSEYSGIENWKNDRWGNDEGLFDLDRTKLKSGITIYIECINWNNATEKLGYTDYLSVNIISKEWQQYSPYSPL